MIAVLSTFIDHKTIYADGLPAFGNSELRKKDMDLFCNVTYNRPLLMGRKTWFGYLCGKPLVCRGKHWVVTGNPEKYKSKNPDRYEFISIEDADKLICKITNLVLIGGKSLYDRYLSECTDIYHNVVSVSPSDNCKTKVSLDKRVEEFIDLPIYSSYWWTERCDDILLFYFHYWKKSLRELQSISENT